MNLSMYDACVPVLVQKLEALAGILDKAARHAKHKGLDPQALLQARLFPDMFPLVRQVQIASDGAKGGAARLAGVPVPAFPDTEASFEELDARIARTIDFLKSLSRAQFQGCETRAISLQLRAGEIGFTGQPFLVGWVLPNFYFHVTTAYNILRHNGVDLGKFDFLGSVPGAQMPGKKAMRKAAKAVKQEKPDRSAKPAKAAQAAKPAKAGKAGKTGKPGKAPKAGTGESTKAEKPAKRGKPAKSRSKNA